MKQVCVSRRRLVASAGALPLAMPLAARALPAAARPVKVAQWLDTTPHQRDLSRDHAAGVQAALAEYNRSAAGQLRPVQWMPMEVPSDAGLSKALSTLRTDPSICALLGTVGESLALRSVPIVRREVPGLMHVGPWLADTRFDGDDDVIPLVASRDVQVRHALSQLHGAGLNEVGVVFGTAAEEELLATAVSQAGTRLALGMRPLGVLDSDRLARHLAPGASAPAVLLFVGGTLELARFTQALAQRRLVRYVVSLADIDVATLVQLGSGKAVPLIVTQVVPNPTTSNLPAARKYRDQLKLLFEEAPSPVGLAGYLAARYFTQVLARIEGPVTRTAAQQAFSRRPEADLDGFGIRFSAGSSRGSRYVTQAMLTADGRLVA